MQTYMAGLPSGWFPRAGGALGGLLKPMATGSHTKTVLSLHLSQNVETGNFVPIDPKHVTMHLFLLLLAPPPLVLHTTSTTFQKTPKDCLDHLKRCGGSDEGLPVVPPQDRSATCGFACTNPIRVWRRDFRIHRLQPYAQPTPGGQMSSPLP